MNKFLLLLMAAGLVSCLGYNCKAADSETERQTLQILKEMNKKLDAIDARLKKLEERKSVNTAPGVNNNTDNAALEKITLPANPTKEQVSEYIQKIVNASRDQRSFSSRDLQVAMLERVGKKNLDILLNYYDSTLYMQFVLQDMVSESDKEVILNALKEKHSLIGIVLHMGWERDAKDLIIQELKNNRNNLPSEWIEAAASFNEPKTYPDLIEIFIHSRNPSIIYKAIRKTPGIELKEAVSKMWDKKRLSNFSWEKDDAAIVAVEWGHLDALTYLINRLKQPQLNQHISEEIKNAVWQTTGQSGSAEELAKWMKENSDKLTFDDKTGKYVMKKAGDAK